MPVTPGERAAMPTPVHQAGAASPAHRGAGHRGLKLVLAAMERGAIVILVLLVVLLSIVSDVFLSFENVGNVLKQSAVVCVLALGQLLVIVTRGIDLSVGSNLSLSAVVGAMVWRDHGSATLSVAAALASGCAVGAVNGLLYVDRMRERFRQLQGIELRDLLQDPLQDISLRNNVSAFLRMAGYGPYLPEGNARAMSGVIDPPCFIMAYESKGQRPARDRSRYIPNPHKIIMRFCMHVE